MVLIFEDNEIIRELLTFFFQKRGYKPLTFEDTGEAAKHAREHSPVLILMDIIMPGQDGIAACAELRREGIRTPILMLTSKPYEVDRERAMAAGANAYMLKPFNTTALDAAIRSLLAL